MTLTWILVLGVAGMVLSMLLLTSTHGAPRLDEMFMVSVMLIGTWILNGLGVAWAMHTMRRIRLASNTDDED